MAYWSDEANAFICSDCGLAVDSQFEHYGYYGCIAALRAQLAALRAAGEQEKKYELGRLALLAGVVANDEVSAHEMSEQIAQAIITLRAQLAAGEWRPVSEAPPTPGPRAARRQNDEHS